MEPEDLQRVTNALNAVGASPRVPFEVTAVESDGPTLRIAVTLHYRRATPVCCGEPGCYVPFLGSKRDDVASALAIRLERVRPPSIAMTVRTRHEPGYQYLEPQLARPMDATLEYEPAHFRTTG